ncbi:MerR family DNA-binding transcriptional regulator [Streptomyces bottropensis]|uniref:MerR family DNA-binding transcriptional regulator n=1 Tax=Streptomyces bottropensis TaxID=42235 RepID=UPI003799A42F
MPGPPRLRPVDLARLCGVSTQQIRNYETAGVLPPVPRTDSGYRVFGDAHRRALLTYRALSKGYGAVAATRIMRTVHEGDVPGALALVDEVHATLHAERVSLRTTGEALRTLAGEPPEDDVPATDLLIGEVAALLGVRTSTLRVWEAAGLLTPRRERDTGYRHYAPEEVRDARFILALRRDHYLLDQIRPVLEDLRDEGGTEALRTAITARRTALTSRTAAMLEGAGHLYTYLALSDGATSD